MAHPPKLIAIVGSTSQTSRTKVLVEALVAAVHARTPVHVELLELATLAPDIGGAVSKDGLGPQGAAAIAAIESADLVIAASPVYKGSYAGLFKHLIDFVHPDALVGTPVLLAATGGSDRHALSVDHQLRPLFSFFRAQTVPSAVYASEADFDGYTVRSPALLARVEEAAQQAADLLAAAAQRDAQSLRAAA